MVFLTPHFAALLPGLICLPRTDEEPKFTTAERKKDKKGKKNTGKWYAKKERKKMKQKNTNWGEII